MKFYILLYVYSLKYCFDLKAFPCRGSFLDLNFDNLFNFFYIPMLPLTLFFVYRHDYSFSSGKKWLFSEMFFLFLGRHVQSKNKQLFRQILPTAVQIIRISKWKQNVTKSMSYLNLNISRTKNGKNKL